MTHAPLARPEPTSAERARTVLVAAPILEVRAFGSTWTVPTHGVDPSGRPLLLVPDRLVSAQRPAIAAPAARAVVDAAQLHVVRTPDRVRTRLQVRGTIGAVPEHERDRLLADQGDVIRVLDILDGHTVLRVEPAQVLVDGLPVPLAAYRTAEPDPLVAVETAQLEDLLFRRPGDLAWLCTLLGPEPVAAATTIAPLGLDRYGLTVRITGPAGSIDHRLAFPYRVDRCETLRDVLRRLVGTARTLDCTLD